MVFQNFHLTKMYKICGENTGNSYTICCDIAEGIAIKLKKLKDFLFCKMKRLSLCKKKL